MRSNPVAYHGTWSLQYGFFDLDKTTLGLHVGTVYQARRVATRFLSLEKDFDDSEDSPTEYRWRLFRVNFTPKKILRLPDLVDWNPKAVWRHLFYEGIVDTNDAKTIEAMEEAGKSLREILAFLRNKMISAGYDTIVYRNGGEVDPTRTFPDSYIILDLGIINEYRSVVVKLQANALD